MRKAIFILAALMACPMLSYAQLGNLTLKHFPGAATGSCSRNQVAQNDSTGAFYNCVNGSWNAVSGGSGTVTDGAGTTTANELLASTTTAHTYSVVATLPTAAMPALTGDVTNPAGSLATTVGRVNGAALPTSTAFVGTNSGGQIVAAAYPTLCTGNQFSQGLSSGSNNCVTPGGAGSATYTTSTTATASDNGKLVVMACTAACSYTLPATQPSTTWAIAFMTIGSTNATIALGGTDTFNGTTSAPVPIKFRTMFIGANTQTSTDYEGNAPLVAGTGLALTPAANGLTLGFAVANTTFSTGTTAVSANTCTTSATVTMNGVATTSVFMISPSTDVSASTGWGSSGGLVIDAWPTANTLNYKVCNQTASSITPTAVTWNVSAR